MIERRMMQQDVVRSHPFHAEQELVRESGHDSHCENGPAIIG